MTETLLVNFDPVLAERLARLFESHGHRIRIHVKDENFSVRLHTPPDLDLAVIDVSAYDSTVRRHLAELQAFRAKHGPRPMLLCVSRVYRGPQFELQLERKGARLAYVR